MHKHEEIIDSDGINGLQGITCSPHGTLIVGSILSGEIYELDVRAPGLKVVVENPYGSADDLTFDSDRRLIWAATLEGEIRSLTACGDTETLAKGLDRPTAVRIGPNGKLYATPFDGLYEIPLGGSAPQRILEIEDLNGFDFDDEGTIFAPKIDSGEVIKIDPETGRVNTFARLFRAPGAVRLGPKGEVWVLDIGRGQLIELDPADGSRRRSIQCEPGIDKFTISGDGLLYATEMGSSSIVEVDPESLTSKEIYSGLLSLPGGIDIRDSILYVANLFDIRAHDLQKGNTEVLGRLWVDWGTNYESSDSIAPHQRFNFRFPCYISTNSTDLFASDPISNGVIMLNRKTGLRAKLFSDLGRPRGLVCINERELLVASHQWDQITVLDSISGHVEVWLEGLKPQDLTLLDSENVLVSSEGDFSDTSKLLRVNLGSKQVTLIKDCDWPAGSIAVADGKIWTLNVNAQTLEVITFAGDQEGSISVPIGASPISSYIGHSAGIASDEDNAMYSSSHERSTILRLNLQ